MTLDQFRNRARNDALSSESDSVYDRCMIMNDDAVNKKLSLVLDGSPNAGWRMVAVLAERLATIEAFLEKQGLSIGVNYGDD